MQHPLSRFLFSQYHNFTFGKLAAALPLCALLLYLSGTRYPGTDQPEHAGKSANLAGDLWHRFGGRLIWKKNYLYLYRNADFVIWKLFSSFLLFFFSASDRLAKHGRHGSHAAAYLCPLSGRRILSA